jgi:hypothetical protein
MDVQLVYFAGRCQGQGEITLQIADEHSYAWLQRSQEIREGVRSKQKLIGKAHHGFRMDQIQQLLLSSPS